MRIIGLTGGIACGKSTVSAMLTDQGIRVVDADKLARAVVAPGQPAWGEIREWLGEDVFLSDGNLDRRKIAGRIFGNEAARRRLESIIHPRVYEAMTSAIAEGEQQGFDLIVLDIPLLYETGRRELVDKVWVVYVDPETQLRRLMARDGLDREQALARVASQMALTEKVRQADLVIDNSGSRQTTQNQVAQALSKVLSEK